MTALADDLHALLCARGPLTNRELAELSGQAVWDVQRRMRSLEKSGRVTRFQMVSNEAILWAAAPSL